MDLNTILATVSVVIIAALSVYAGMLMTKIKHAKAQTAKQLKISADKTKARNEHICDSIRVIATATTQKQCGVSEATIRLSVLLETLIIDKPIAIDLLFPSMSALFEKIKNMPTLEQRKQYPVKEIKKFDMRRKVYEAEYEEAIYEEVKQLTHFNCSEL